MQNTDGFFGQSFRVKKRSVTQVVPGIAAVSGGAHDEGRTALTIAAKNFAHKCTESRQTARVYQTLTQKIVGESQCVRHWFFVTVEGIEDRERVGFEVEFPYTLHALFQKRQKACALSGKVA